MKIKRVWLKQSAVTKRRLKPFLIPKEELASEIVRICEIFDNWKKDPTQPAGCLNCGYTVRTNLHKIPFSEMKHRVVTSLSGTEFQLTKDGKFSFTRREKLWRDSIARAEYIMKLPVSLDKTR